MKISLAALSLGTLLVAANPIAPSSVTQCEVWCQLLPLVLFVLTSYQTDSHAVSITQVLSSEMKNGVNIVALPPPRIAQRPHLPFRLPFPPPTTQVLPHLGQLKLSLCPLSIFPKVSHHPLSLLRHRLRVQLVLATRIQKFRPR